MSQASVNVSEDGYYERKLSSDITLHSIREGFFKDYLDQIDFQLPQEFIEGFSRFKTDEDRFAQIWNFKPIHNIKVKHSYKNKNREMAELHRTEGNKAFQENKNGEALKLYSEAILLSPQDGECLSLSYANRSAVLYHQEDYQLCLNDIQLATEAHYPTRLMFKVLDRKGQCLMKLGKFNQAEKAFSAALEALADSGLERKKLDAWKRDLHMKNQQCLGKEDADDDEKIPCSAAASVYRGVNPALPSASSVVTIHHSQTQGRYAVAQDTVPAGQILITEKPYATAMKADKVSNHCYNCFKRLVAPVACQVCSGVAFCSIGCRNLANATHHKWECMFSDLLAKSGMSLNCYLALRIITQHGLSFFKKIQSQLKEPRGIPLPSSPHRPNDYLSVYNLAGLEDQRPPSNFIPLAIMAAFLLKVLKRGNFFGNWDDKGIVKNNLTKDEALIGGLLLRNLQVVQFNAHEVSGIGFNDSGCRFESSRSVFLGIGIYPTASFCNHSCYPSVTRYFEGTKLFLVNLKPLQPGDTIAENYGPIFTRNTLQERQKKLFTNYWFKCNCDACLNDWPTYAKLTSSTRLPCQKCQAALPPRIPKESHVKCKDCGSSQNVIQALNKMDEADKFYQDGKSNIEKGKHEEAINSFLSYVDVAYRLAYLPMYELFVAFDSLRMLYVLRNTIQIINTNK